MIDIKTLFSYFDSFGFGAIISAVVVTIVKNWLDKNSENKMRIKEKREQQYKDFLNNLMGFFEGWEDKKMQKQFIWDMNTNATISASDEVYRLARNYIDSFDKKKNVNEEERQKIYAKIVLTIRNELNKMSGGKDTTLSENEIKVMKLD